MVSPTGAPGLRGIAFNLVAQRWIRKPSPGVVGVELLRLAGGGRHEARMFLRVRGQVGERVEHVEPGGSGERAELLPELVERGAAPHENGAALKQRLQS